MGEVYRATDTRLERDVAIKVLPAAFSGNAQLKVRFEREAKTISGLGHPHICTLYDIGHENGIDYLVLELLEGESLADRLARGPLPMEQVLRYGAQIAEALDKAHRNGIVHRDLKPGNVMLTKSGAKLLDFGLARTGATPLSSSDLTTGLGATEHKPLTQEGTIVGTFQYMAPEQLDGRVADARSDIFALGAVLYEMATGRRAFDGKSKASLIASILDRDPTPISSLQPMTPPAFERVVQQCLRKDPDERWQSAHDIATELRWSSEGTPAASSRRRATLPWITASILLGVLALALGLALMRRTQAPPRMLRAEINPPPNTAINLFLDAAGAITISPDGKWITFSAVDDKGDEKLWLRATDSLEARPIEAATGATYPFWSPDSRSLGFFAGGKVKRLDINGGPVTTIATGLEPRGAAWNSDGTIIFAPHWRGALSRVPATGGKVEPLTALAAERSETTHRFPSFLPDGEHFLYLAGTHLASTESDLNAIYVGSLKTKEQKLVLRARSNAIYSAGHLLFVRDNYLLAQPFDLDELKLTGEPRRIADNVYYSPGFFRASFSAADDGTLVYTTGGGSALRKLIWRDRNGLETDAGGEPGMFELMNISPDGKKVVTTINDPADLWVQDLERGIRRPVTSEPLNEFFPMWSHDGKMIVYASDRDIHWDMYMRPADGTGADVVLLRTPNQHEIASDWSRDGRFLLFDSAPLSAGNASDIWVLPMTGERKPYPLIRTSFNDSAGMFSPDGRWVAYISNESGRDEIYVTAFDGTGARQQVSTSGTRGVASWRSDGNELLYVARDGTVTAVAVKVNGNTIETSAPKPLFKLTRAQSLGDFAPDGQRFLIMTSGAPNTAPLTLVTGWH